MPRRIGAADHRADRGADHHIGNDAMGNQRPDDADMGKSARGAAAQREANHRPPDAAEPYLVAATRVGLAAPDQIIQHRRSPESTKTNSYRPTLPECTTSMVYATVR